MKKYIVLDVESLDLYGRPFLACFLACNGTEIEQQFIFRTDDFEGSEVSDFVAKNVLPNNKQFEVNCVSYEDFLDKCYNVWMHLKTDYPRIVAHCAYPVETHFMRELITFQIEKGNENASIFDGPYPGFFDLHQELQRQGYEGDSVEKFLGDSSKHSNHNVLNDCIDEMNTYCRLFLN